MPAWNNAIYNSGAHWGPATAQSFNPNKHRKTKAMKREPYFPRTVSDRPDWFGNYATQLPIANATLALAAPAVTASVADARFCQYACGAWLTATREFGPASTSALDDLFNGSSAAAFVLPPFTVPALPAGVSPVTAGALLRIFDFAQTIKASPNYTEAIGLQLVPT